jgi:hypothetical protein
MRWTLALLLVPMSACLQLSTGDPTGTSGSSSSGSTTSTSSSGAATGSSGGATTGTNCTTDPQSGITLCEQIANCPGVDVDQGAFPGCGFRLHASSIYDLECGCGDSLCPIGTPTSCTTALQLLNQQQSSIIVCEQLDQGSCLPLDDAGTSSNCDKSCESACAGDPNCIQMCGC